MVFLAIHKSIFVNLFFTVAADFRIGSRSCLLYSCLQQFLNASFVFYKQLVIMISKIVKSILQKSNQTIVVVQWDGTYEYSVDTRQLLNKWTGEKITFFSAVILHVWYWSLFRQIFCGDCGWYKELHQYSGGSTKRTPCRWSVLLLCSVCTYRRTNREEAIKKSRVRQAYKWFCVLRGRLTNKTTCSGETRTC